MDGEVNVHVRLCVREGRFYGVERLDGNLPFWGRAELHEKHTVKGLTFALVVDVQHTLSYSGDLLAGIF